MTTLEAATPDFEELVRASVLTMPASKQLGFAFSRIAPGEVEIIQPHREDLTIDGSSFQGGVVGMLADIAAGSAGRTLLAPGWVNMTVDYTVKILAPANGETVVARARVIKAGKVMTVAAADVYTVDGGEEKLCAIAFVSMRNVQLSKD
jgi:uncharacterized protein (TIGR00369 family)